MVQPQIHVLRCRYRELTDWSHDAMGATYWRLYWNTSPGAWIARGEQRLDLAPDQVILVPPGPPLQTGNHQPFEHLFVHFTLSPEIRPTSSLLRSLPLRGGFHNRVKQLKRAVCSPSLSPIQNGFLVIHTIVAALGRLPPDTWHPPARDARIRAVQERMGHQRYARTSCAEFARQEGLHPKSFSRLFRQETGLPPQRFHLQTRIDRAAADLSDPENSVDQVAETWGFSDRYHFTHALKRLRGTTPGALRKLQETILGEAPFRRYPLGVSPTASRKPFENC